MSWCGIGPGLLHQPGGIQHEIEAFTQHSAHGVYLTRFS